MPDMADTMLERMAEAAWVAVAFPHAQPTAEYIAELKEEGRWWPNVGQYIGPEGFRAAARAALEAIREPSEEMVREARECDPGYDQCSADGATHWRAMIDAILNDTA